MNTSDSKSSAKRLDATKDAAIKLGAAIKNREAADVEYAAAVSAFHEALTKYQDFCNSEKR